MPAKSSKRKRVGDKTLATKKPCFSIDRLYPSSVREELDPAQLKKGHVQLLKEYSIVFYDENGSVRQEETIANFDYADLAANRVQVPMRCVESQVSLSSVPPMDRDYVRAPVGRQTVTSHTTLHYPSPSPSFLREEEEVEYRADPVAFDRKMGNVSWHHDKKRTYWIVDGANRVALCSEFHFGLTAVILHPRLCYKVAEAISEGLNSKSTHVCNETSFLDRVIKTGEWTADGYTQPVQADLLSMSTPYVSKLYQCYVGMRLTSNN